MVQRLKEAKSRSRKSKSSTSAFETPKGPRPSGVQLSITEFYRHSKKGLSIESGKKPVGEGEAAKEGSRKASDRDPNNGLLKSTRRRLHFD